MFTLNHLINEMERCTHCTQGIDRIGLSFSGMMVDNGEEKINCFVPFLSWLMLLVRLGKRSAIG